MDPGAGTGCDQRPTGSPACAVAAIAVARYVDEIAAQSDQLPILVLVGQMDWRDLETQLYPRFIAGGMLVVGVDPAEKRGTCPPGRARQVRRPYRQL
jgi:hypothetical protein